MTKSKTSKLRNDASSSNCELVESGLPEAELAAGERLLSVEINPVLALPDGAYALDAVIELRA